MQKFVYTIKDPVGLHARPAGLLAKEAAKYTSQLTLTCNGKSADAKRIIALMTLGIKQGMEITLTADGDDEATALQALEGLIRENL